MKKKKYVVFLIAVLGVVLAVFGIVFLEFNGVVFGKATFGDNTYINGVNVSGLNKIQAQNVVTTQMLSERKDVVITLKYKDTEYVLKGEDFEVDNGISAYVENVFNYVNSGSFFKRKARLKSQEKNSFDMTYSQRFVGLNEKIDDICKELFISAKDAELTFDVTQKNPLVFTNEVVGRQVDKQKLCLLIDKGLIEGNVVDVDIPVEEVQPTVTKAELMKTFAKRSEFSTSYEKSSLDRKFNIQKSLSAFNGMKVEVGEEVSFNQTTGPRSAENGYKKANIILNGVYIEGYGGGVCQASTTLYNALLCADVKVLEANKHTLPSSYVWLGFDAMVSEGISDLRFVNNTNKPLYIRTVCDSKDAKVEIFGESLNNQKFERRVEFVESIPHPGDRIILDTQGKYSNKVTYKGEYFRLKYPKEGYHAKAYIDKYIDGVLVESKLVRDAIYDAQEGIIIEGVEEVTEGITLPDNDVRFIPAQQRSLVNKDNVQSKLKQENPPNYNP